MTPLRLLAGATAAALLTFGCSQRPAEPETPSGDDDDAAAVDDDDSSTDDDDSAASDDDDLTPVDDDDVAPDDDDAAPDDDDSAPVDPCDGSPVVGTWEGTFTGDIDSILTGPQSVEGDLGFDITCTDRLIIEGTMTGAEEGGVPFSATVVGEYDAATDLLTATLDGIVAFVITFTGNFDGALVSSSPYTLDGTWDGTAPSVSGTGTGLWTAELQP